MRYYSTSTTKVGFEDSADFVGLVDFAEGIVTNGLKTVSFHVRAVRTVQSRLLYPLIISFTATPLSGTVPLAVTFSCSAFDPDGGSITQYSWDFDNNGTVDQATTAGSVTHTFSASGTYSVTCTAADDEGATVKSNPVIITVSAAVDPYIVCL